MRVLDGADVDAWHLHWLQAGAVTDAIADGLRKPIRICSDLSKAGFLHPQGLKKIENFQCHRKDVDLYMFSSLGGRNLCIQVGLESRVFTAVSS